MHQKPSIESTFKHTKTNTSAWRTRIAGAILFALSTAAFGASFSCTKESTAVEKSICTNNALSQLDTRMAGAYKRLKQSNPEAVYSQRDWLRYRRNKCASLDCLERTYNERIEQLTNGTWQDIGLTAAAAGSQPISSGNIVYYQTRKADINLAADWLQKTKVLESYLAAAKPYYTFRPNLKVYAKECGEVNAFYYDSQSAVVVCYELIYKLIVRANALKQERPAFPESQHVQILHNSIGWVLLHELGHAALHRQDSIPGLGPEEAEADTFASVIMLDLQRSSNDRLNALYGVSSFAEIFKIDPTDLRAYSDEHGFPYQRYVTFACLAIGTDNSLMSPLVSSRTVTERRAKNCSSEWRTRRAAVMRLPRPLA